ncbi:MAG: nicotinate-nucleotide adenylyltransferase [Planctomycetaceae bacterium]
MKLGIFGGTFDPVHLGHLVLAEWCREECELDEVWFVPAPSPPHKDDHTITPAKQRAEMLDFAVSGCPHLGVSRIEFEREGPSYTVDTLQQLATEGADRELFLLIGADSLNDFGSWRQPERIAELATIVAVNRGRDALPSAEETIALVGKDVANRVQHIHIPPIDISATEIRARVEAGNSIRFLTPRAVEAFIRENKLYAENA